MRLFNDLLRLIRPALLCRKFRNGRNAHNKLYEQEVIVRISFEISFEDLHDVWNEIRCKEPVPPSRPLCLILFELATNGREVFTREPPLAGRVYHANFLLPSGTPSGRARREAVLKARDQARVAALTAKQEAEAQAETERALVVMQQQEVEAQQAAFERQPLQHPHDLAFIVNSTATCWMGPEFRKAYLRKRRVEIEAKVGKESDRDYSAVMGNPALTVWCKRPLQAQRTKARGKGRRTVKRSGRRRI